MRRKNKNLEEISIHDLNRIGDKLDEDVKTLEENIKPEDTELVKYIQLYTDMIKTHNKFVRETNSYIEDYRIKYYKNKKTGDLSYTKHKKDKIGF